MIATRRHPMIDLKGEGRSGFLAIILFWTKLAECSVRDKAIFVPLYYFYSSFCIYSSLSPVPGKEQKREREQGSKDSSSRSLKSARSRDYRPA